MRKRHCIGLGAAMAILAGLGGFPAAAQVTQTAMATTSASMAHRTIPGQIMDLHHRWIITGDQYPWSAIGRLTTDGGYCSGAMIGRRLVLTAAHCFWSKTTKKRVSAGSLRFSVGYKDGGFLASASVRRVHIAPGFDGAAEYTDTMAAKDWALVELTEDLGAVSGTLGIETFTSASAKVAAR
ncbi:MAG: trypsin-like serine protease, partial [Alphaproteobacteria bacterium]